MPSTTERKTELPPFKSRLQDWYEITRTANPEDTKKLLMEGYGLLFDILDPVAQDGTIDPRVYARVHNTTDRRLRYFDDKFLPEKYLITFLVKVKDYSRSKTGEKRASLVFTDGFHVASTRSITVSYNPRNNLQYMSPDGFMRIEETKTAIVRSGSDTMDAENTKSLTELPPTKLLALTLSLAHIYAEDREK